MQGNKVKQERRQLGTEEGVGQPIQPSKVLNLCSAQSCTVSDKFYLPAALRLNKTKGSSHAKLGP